MRLSIWLFIFTSIIFKEFLFGLFQDLFHFFLEAVCFEFVCFFIPVFPFASLYNGILGVIKASSDLVYAGSSTADGEADSNDYAGQQTSEESLETEGPCTEEWGRDGAGDAR